MNELALFAGAGGGILAGQLLGWTCVGACEIERYPREVLLARQRDGILSGFPIWDDVRTFDGKPWRGLVDVVSGGFPCQDISCAGKGIGISGERSGLWEEMHRIIREVRPRFAYMENSPMLVSRGLGRVLGDLAEAGYDAAWTCLSAADCGAPHRRERIWVLAADTNAARLPQGAPVRLVREGGRAQPSASCVEVPDTDSRRRFQKGKQGKLGEVHEWRIHAGGATAELCTGVSDTDMPGREKQRQPEPAGEEHATAQRGGWWSVEPNVGRMANGVAARVDRLKALGNGQVPIVAATAFHMLYKQLTGKEYKQ